MDAEERKLLPRFRKRINDELRRGGFGEREENFCTDGTLIRYMRARSHDLDKSLRMLLETLRWRAEFCPQDLRAGPLSDEANSGKMYRRGLDLDGQPVLFLTPARENTSDHENQIRLLVYTLEKICRSMTNELGKMSIIIDFKGYSIRNAPPMKISKLTLHILSDHYPERMARCVMVDPPALFYGFFKMISPFIDQKTKDKIVFVPNKEKRLEVMKGILPEDEIEERFGGRRDSTYDHDTHWQSEMDSDHVMADKGSSDSDSSRDSSSQSGKGYSSSSEGSR